MSQRILVVEDEKSIQRTLRISLEAAGFEVRVAGDGQQALDSFTRQLPDLVLLDLGLPDTSGIKVLQQIREASRIPVIILSVRDQERQKVEALDYGAHDYLTKPFGVPELLARIRAALRNSAERQHIPETQFCLGPLRVDQANHLVLKREQPIKLTKTEYKIFTLLIRHAGKVLTHRQMLDEIWGEACRHETHYLQVYISQLRRKLEDDPTEPRMILTEPGMGYRLAAEI